MLCTTSESLCPITAVSLALDSSNNYALSVSKEPNSLPISHFKFSTGTPCIKESEEPSSTKGSFLDEYTRSSTLGCTEDDFKKVSDGSDEKATIDTNYQRVGTFTVNQGELEASAGISKIFQSRFLRNDAESYDARF